MIPIVEVHNALVDGKLDQVLTHRRWLDEVATSLNGEMAHMVENRPRELLVRDIRECFDDIRSVANRMLLERAKLLELEPLASLLAEAMA